jgi:hypothetical protein
MHLQVGAVVEVTEEELAEAEVEVEAGLEAGEEAGEEEASDLAGEEDKLFKKVRFSAPLLVWSLKFLVTKPFEN